jgi:predicted nucleic acid-binding protein
MILLDTNVLSELMKPTPDAGVMDWISARPATTMYTSSITQAEILHGVMLCLRASAAALRGCRWERCFVMTSRAGFFRSADAAPLYAQIAVSRRKARRPISHFDADRDRPLVECTIATRNVSDFEGWRREDR